MRVFDSSGTGLARRFGAALLLVALSACTSTGGSSGSASLTPGAKSTFVVPSDSAYSAQMFLDPGYCPPLEIRPGTEALMIYERNHDGDPNYIRFQGSITKTARECHTLGADTLTIKVGIAGRLTAGPKGVPGKYALPLRIAVVKQQGNQVFHTEMRKVELIIAAPAFAADFTEVFELAVKVTPADRDLIVFVGYDEGNPKPKPNA